MKDKSTYSQTKILLAKAILKNWEKASETEKKAIERWWKQTYGKFKKKNEIQTCSYVGIKLNYE